MNSVGILNLTDRLTDGINPSAFNSTDEFTDGYILSVFHTLTDGFTDGYFPSIKHNITNGMKIRRYISSGNLFFLARKFCL